MSTKLSCVKHEALRNHAKGLAKKMNAHWLKVFINYLQVELWEKELEKQA